MMLKNFRQNLKVPAYRDLFFIAVTTVLLIILGLTIHWTEYCVDLLYETQEYPIDDVIMTILLMIYAFKRNREHKRIIRDLHLREKEINLKNEELEILMKSSSAVL